MLNPTGMPIRGSDKWGEGRYGASRGSRIHEGADYICEPGQPVRAPIEGEIVREAKPYPESGYSGLLIQGKYMAIKMFYLEPFRDMIGKHVAQGDIIGVAQDISKRYDKEMTPHIHLQIEHLNPEILTEMI
jgi:murein DD-endopeptidase MepM/ murein hydrolase activator NlpD